jgi:hypothetical protein
MFLQSILFAACHYFLIFSSAVDKLVFDLLNLRAIKHDSSDETSHFRPIYRRRRSREPGHGESARRNHRDRAGEQAR